jgi:uncharacterized membrane protein YfcA
VESAAAGFFVFQECSWGRSISGMTKLLITGLLVGAAAGLVGALCGVGGGIIMVPAFVIALGMTQKTAVATSLAVVVVSGLSGTINNAVNSDLINWKVVAVTAVGAAVAAWFGADLMRSLSSPQLQKGFAILLIVVGVRMLLMKG